MPEVEVKVWPICAEPDTEGKVPFTGTVLTPPEDAVPPFKLAIIITESTTWSPVFATAIVIS